MEGEWRVQGGCIEGASRVCIEGEWRVHRGRMVGEGRSTSTSGREEEGWVPNKFRKSRIPPNTEYRYGRARTQKYSKPPKKFCKFRNHRFRCPIRKHLPISGISLFFCGENRKHTGSLKRVRTIQSFRTHFPGNVLPNHRMS